MIENPGFTKEKTGHIHVRLPKNKYERDHLMKNTGSHNGYLRFKHEANGGKNYGKQRQSE